METRWGDGCPQVSSASCRDHPCKLLRVIEERQCTVGTSSAHPACASLAHQPRLEARWAVRSQDLSPRLEASRWSSPLRERGTRSPGSPMRSRPPLSPAQRLRSTRPPRIDPSQRSAPRSVPAIASCATSSSAPCASPARGTSLEPCPRQMGAECRSCAPRPTPRHPTQLDPERAAVRPVALMPAAVEGVRQTAAWLSTPRPPSRLRELWPARLRRRRDHPAPPHAAAGGTGADAIAAYEHRLRSGAAGREAERQRSRRARAVRCQPDRRRRARHVAAPLSPARDLRAATPRKTPRRIRAPESTLARSQPQSGVDRGCPLGRTRTRLAALGSSVRFVQSFYHNATYASSRENHPVQAHLLPNTQSMCNQCPTDDGDRQLGGHVKSVCAASPGGAVLDARLSAPLGGPASRAAGRP